MQSIHSLNGNIHTCQSLRLLERKRVQKYQESKTKHIACTDNQISYNILAFIHLIISKTITYNFISTFTFTLLRRLYYIIHIFYLAKLFLFHLLRSPEKSSIKNKIARNATRMKIVDYIFFKTSVSTMYLYKYSRNTNGKKEENEN